MTADNIPEVGARMVLSTATASSGLPDIDAVNEMKLSIFVIDHERLKINRTTQRDTDGREKARAEEFDK